MRRATDYQWAAATLLGLAAAVTTAQEPPRRLPPSVTGPTPVTTNVPATAAPAREFLTRLSSYPQETQAVFLSTRAGIESLYRANLPSGRFLIGDKLDDDLVQAEALLALAEAAAFSGEARHRVRVAGAILCLLTLTQLDPARPGVRVPTASCQGDATEFSAVLVLALLAEDAPPPESLAVARQLGAGLRPRVSPTGTLASNSPTAPGRVLEALEALATHPDEAESARVAMLMTRHYAAAVKPGQDTTATLVPGLVRQATRLKNHPQAVAAVWRIADDLAGRPVGTPGAVRALGRAVWLTRQVPDEARFHRYRAATVAGLATLERSAPDPVARCLTGVAYLRSGGTGPVE